MILNVVLGDWLCVANLRNPQKLHEKPTVCAVIVSNSFEYDRVVSGSGRKTCLPITTTTTCSSVQRANQCPTTAIVCSFLEQSRRVKAAMRLLNGIETTNSWGCFSNKQACCSMTQSLHNPLCVYGVKKLILSFWQEKQLGFCHYLCASDLQVCTVRCSGLQSQASILIRSKKWLCVSFCFTVSIISCPLISTTGIIISKLKCYVFGR